MEKKLEEAVEKKKIKKILQFEKLFDSARLEYTMAVLEERECEIYHLKARLAVSDTNRDMYLAEWDHADQLHDETLESCANFKRIA
eukprot:53502-Prymnesium_polylepis.1